MHTFGSCFVLHSLVLIMASKWALLKQGGAARSGSEEDGAVLTPPPADARPRSAAKSPRIAKALGGLRRAPKSSKSEQLKDTGVNASSSPPKVSKWAKLRPQSSAAAPEAVRAGGGGDPGGGGGVTSPKAKASRWARFKPQQTVQEPASPPPTTTGSMSEPNSPHAQKASRWARFKPQHSTTTTATTTPISPPAPRPVLTRQSALLSPRYEPPSRRPLHTLPRSRAATLPTHAPDGAGPRMSFARLVKNVTQLPPDAIKLQDADGSTPPSSPESSRPCSSLAESSRPSSRLTNASRPASRPASRLRTPLANGRGSTVLPRKRSTLTDGQTDSDVTLTKADADNYSRVSLFQVDEDMKRKLRNEIDVSMVTLLQPTESRFICLIMYSYHISLYSTFFLLTH